jgi:hypothetical protein
VGYLPNLEHRAPLNQLFGLFQRGANMFTRHHGTPISPLKQFRQPLDAILLAKGELTNPGHITATVLALNGESSLATSLYGTPIVQALFNVESSEQHVQWVDLDSPAKQGNGGLTSPIAVIATQVHQRADLHAAVSSTGHTAIIISSRHPP